MSVEAGQVKLMKPLFIDGMFNREGKRIRAKYVKTITYGNKSYPLWISAGKPDKDYVSNIDDQYYLMIEKNDYLIPCGYTEYELEQRCGNEYLDQEWYGTFENRQKYFDDNFYKGRTCEEYSPLVTEQINKENAFIAEHGKDQALQVKFLKKNIDKAIARYIDARDNNGKFADFVGAAFIGELEECDKLSQKLKVIRQQEEAIKKAEYENKRKIELEERLKAEQRKIEETENILVNGGKIDDGKIIIKIADKYGINIPIRTRGWILNTLIECTISDKNNISCCYWKRSKGANGSQKIYDILFAIIRAIKEVKAA
jgi:hypothetical protein